MDNQYHTLTNAITITSTTISKIATKQHRKDLSFAIISTTCTLQSIYRYNDNNFSDVTATGNETIYRIGNA